jgi:hypothetical protein
LAAVAAVTMLQRIGLVLCVGVRASFALQRRSGRSCAAELKGLLRRVAARMMLQRVGLVPRVGVRAFVRTRASLRLVSQGGG